MAKSTTKPWPFNPFTLEGKIELAKLGFTPSRSRKPQKHAKALEQLQRAETVMCRAFRRWDKLRNQVARYERELDQEESGGGMQ